MSDSLDPILTDAGIEGLLVHRDECEAIGRSISGIPPQEFIAAMTLAPGLSWDGERPEAPDFFEIHGQSWWIDLSDANNRQHVLISVAAAAIADALRLDLSVPWVTRVLPTTLTIVSVGRDGTGLHFELLRHAATPLPPHLVNEINLDDYTEFVDAIQRASTVPLPVGGTIEFTGP